MTAMTREEWLHEFCERIGAEPPTHDEIAQLLELAAIAAHDSERPAAPLACWAAGRTDRSPDELREIARQINPA
ncbi:MAG TPA: DUF6457 domain-containing protein [Solirubrobacterales bacterium]|jgi:hypothetical protein|nr:DUF6457 domain-containing protein [Solirubrobacterales bacterium]